MESFQFIVSNKTLFNEDIVIVQIIAYPTHEAGVSVGRWDGQKCQIFNPANRFRHEPLHCRQTFLGKSEIWLSCIPNGQK